MLPALPLPLTVMPKEPSSLLNTAAFLAVIFIISAAFSRMIALNASASSGLPCLLRLESTLLAATQRLYTE